MTVWNIHFLNARHDLTRVLPEVRAAAREAVALISAHADLPAFDLVVEAGTEVAAERGVVARTRVPGLVEMTLNPDRFAPAPVVRALVRAFCHVIRWDGPGYGRSLGEALVSEGLAGHCVQQVLGGPVDPWDAVHPASGLARQASTVWDRLDYDHPRWFLGKGDIRKWAGYGLGYRLVADYLAQNPDETAATLAFARAEAFRPAMRRLVSADGSADELPPGDPDSHDPANGDADAGAAPASEGASEG